MPRVNARTGDVYFAERGAGPPLVLLHANGHDHHDFDDVVPALSQNFRTIALDWPGFGESAPPDPPRSASPLLMAQVLGDIVDALEFGPAMFIGNSIGGFAAARLAIDRPALVRSLVLVDSGGFNRTSPFTRLFCHFKGSERITRNLNLRFAKYYTQRRPPLVNAMLDRIDAGRRIPSRVAVDAAMWRAFPQPESDLFADAGRLSCPTLLVWGKRDPLIKANADGRRALEAIPGSRMIVLDTGHTVFAEAPDEFLAAVEPFLKGVARDARSNATTREPSHS